MKVIDVPIPAKMKYLPKDPRGYPLPVIILRDTKGKPMFAANNDELALKLTMEVRCSICGTHMTDGDIWFAGGPISAFHPAGAYHDGPMHHECCTYAMQVCPYLALPNYSSIMTPKTVSKMGAKAPLPLHDVTVIPERPQCFVMIKVSNYQVNIGGSSVYTISPVRPALDVEAWKDGQRLTPDDAKVFISRAIAEQQERDKEKENG